MSSTAKRKFIPSDIDALMDHAIEANGSVIIRRPGRKDLAIIAADQLRELDTTDYLLASPKNRRRLQSALREARIGKGRRMTVAQLKHHVGLASKD